MRRIWPELVVHFQPVVFDPVLDPGAGQTVFLAVGEHFAVEARVQAPAEEGEDVGGREVQQGMVEQAGIQVGQRGAVAEEDIGAVLGLVDDPVVAAAAEPGRPEQRIDDRCPAVQEFHPGQVRETIREFLGLGRIVELREGVVVLLEAEALLEHLPGEPLVAVDVDLDGEREPGLDADVHQAEVGIEEIVVEHPVGPAAKREAWPALAVQQFDGAAAFLDTEHGDQAVAAGAFAKQLADQGVLVRLGLEVAVGSVGLLGLGLRVGDERIGLLFHEGEEVLTAHFQGMIDEAVEVIVAAEGEIALEKDTIMAGEDGYNGGGELGDEGNG